MEIVSKATTPQEARKEIIALLLHEAKQNKDIAKTIQNKVSKEHYKARSEALTEMAERIKGIK